MALAERTHFSAPRRPKQASTGEQDHEMNNTAAVRTHPLPQAACTVYDEEMLAAGVRPALLSELAGRKSGVSGAQWNRSSS